MRVTTKYNSEYIHCVARQLRKETHPTKNDGYYSRRVPETAPSQSYYDSKRVPAMSMISGYSRVVTTAYLII